ncbi:MAG: type II toxin-antitoxin system antitoxin, RelB/DinJ family [bacterium]
MKTVLNVKTDIGVKKEAQLIAEEIGISLSTIINIYLKQFIRDKEIRVSAVPEMTPELEKRLSVVERDIRRGKNISPSFSSAKEAMRYLSSI